MGTYSITSVPHDAPTVDLPALPWPFGLRAETELLPRNADSFAEWPNGWLDESTGTTNPPRAFSDRASSTVARDGYTLFESTGSTNLLRIVSPPFTLNAAKNHLFYMKSKTFSGTPSVNAYLHGFEQGGDTGTSSVQFLSAYDPGSSFAKTAVRLYAAGGSSPALPAGTDRAILRLDIATNAAAAFGIKDIYFGPEELWSNNNPGSGLSGAHEAVFDGSHVYMAVFFAGFIAKMNPEGTYSTNITTGGGVNPHQIIADGSHLYCAEWDGQKVTKRLKTVHTGSSPVASISLSSQAFGLCILGGYLFVTTVDEKLHRIQLSDFSLVNSWDLSASMNNSSTQCTPVAMDGSIWIHATEDGKVVRINASTGAVIATINPPAGFGSSVKHYGFGGHAGKLYCSFHNGTICEYDPATNAISNSWHVGVAATSQLKSDGTAIWFVGQTPFPYLVRFNPTLGQFHRMPMRRVGGGKWCEIVEDEVWCGGLDAGRIERFARF